MKSVFQPILFCVLTTYSISIFSQSRFSEKEIVNDHDTTFLKKDMHKVTGLVYNEYGDVGEFVNGLRKGLHKEWYRSGNLKDEINYTNGVMEGEYRYWSDHGQLTEEGHHKNGEMDGLIREWYKNGALKLEVHYKNGEMHGLRTEWYKSGHKWSEQQMEDGFVVSGKHYYNDGSEMTHGSIIKH